MLNLQLFTSALSSSPLACSAPSTSMLFSGVEVSLSRILSKKKQLKKNKDESKDGTFSPQLSFITLQTSQGEPFLHYNSNKKKSVFPVRCCKLPDSPRCDDVIPNIHGVQFSIRIAAGPPSDHELQRIH